MREITSGSRVLMSLRHRPSKIEQVLPQDKWKYLRTYRYRQDIKISIVLKNSTEVKRPDISYCAAKIHMLQLAILKPIF